MDFPVEDIVDLIPQKPPFVMVSKLLYTDPKITRSSFVIDEDNVFVINGIFQEAGLMENMAQTTALGAGYLAKTENMSVIKGFIAAVKDLEVFSLPGINDMLITEISIENRIFNVSVISGKVWCNGELIAACEMKLFEDSQQHLTI